MFFEEYEVSANALRLMDAENAARILEHVEDYEVRRKSPAGRLGRMAERFDDWGGIDMRMEIEWKQRRKNITGLCPTGNSIA